MMLLKQSSRLYVQTAQLDAAIAFYEQLQAVPCERRIPFPQMGIDVAVVGAFILLAGDAAALAPVRHVRATLTVAKLDAVIPWLHARGGVLLSGPVDAAFGRHLTARHPDGLVVEYFEAAPLAG